MDRIAKIIVALCFCLFLAQASYAQDPTFSQFYTSTMFLNPAMAADGQDPNAIIANRIYTNSQLSQYRLTHFSGNYQFKIQPQVYGRRNKFDHNSGAGITAYQEATGANNLNTTGFFGTVAHSIQFSKAHYLALGIQAGYAQKKLSGDFDWGSEYVYGVGHDENIEGYIEDGEVGKGYFTLNAGMMWFYNQSKLKKYMRKHNFDAFAGFAAYNLNSPNISVTDNKTRLPLNFKLNGGLKFSVHPQVHVFPTFVYMRQNGNNHMNIGFYSNIKSQTAVYAKKAKMNFIGGLWYRLGDAVVPLIGVSMYDFKLLISYDINASKFKYKNRGKGAAEVSLKYTLHKTQEKYTRGLLYPSF